MNRYNSPSSTLPALESGFYDDCFTGGSGWSDQVLLPSSVQIESETLRHLQDATQKDLDALIRNSLNSCEAYKTRFDRTVESHQTKGSVIAIIKDRSHNYIVPGSVLSSSDGAISGPDRWRLPVAERFRFPIGIVAHVSTNPLSAITSFGDNNGYQLNFSHAAFSEAKERAAYRVKEFNTLLRRYSANKNLHEDPRLSVPTLYLGMLIKNATLLAREDSFFYRRAGNAINYHGFQIDEIRTDWKDKQATVSGNIIFGSDNPESAGTNHLKAVTYSLSSHLTSNGEIHFECNDREALSRW